MWQPYIEKLNNVMSFLVENYAKLKLSANYTYCKNGDIEEDVKLDGPNEEKFLKNIEVYTPYSDVYMLML